ncbi:MAG: acetoacetate--CoA ligase [Proteobacteria bacterium]|nr:acetoacetate--CoA ligase [Pseudomonadota bacterium]
MNKLCWRPDPERIRSSNMFRFMEHVNKIYNNSFTNYEDLYQWSINEPEQFWATLWEQSGIIHSGKYHQVVDDIHKMPGASWFKGVKLNFAENLLRYRDDQIALSFKGENQDTQSISYKDLYDEVARLAKALRDVGVVKGDRVAGFVPNMIETVIAMLATTSIGAIWSSCSPDFGIKGVLDRFCQIKPKILFTANGYFYNGKTHDSLGKINEILQELPSIEKVIVIPYIDQDLSALPQGIWLEEFIDSTDIPELQFEQVEFADPLYIMYSSGTTGVPKCIVHSVGGTLIQQIKELKLHSNVTREDTIFYFTTCGWMMWNWLVSSLSLGARVMLYDGSPFSPSRGSMWKLIHDEQVTIFGTSAKFLAECEKAGVNPKKCFDQSQLKTILSTGSTLSEESYEYVYRDVKEDLQLSSISGGTDIVSCFALGNPMGSVYSGELQVRGLGMKVEAFDEQGEGMIAEKGELVCSLAAPCMPISFWDDKGDKKYRAAYFETFPGIWHHGDYIEVTKRGGVIIYGRSDATLNPGGVRIGTAEIYRQVDSIPEVLDSLLIGQNWQDDVRIILFVKLRENIELTEELIQQIKTTIRKGTSPRHVPAKVLDVEDIPYTISGKKVELAVKKIIQGEVVKNRDALANPQALEFFQDRSELLD